MFTAIYTVLLILSLGLIYFAGRTKAFRIQMTLILALLIGTAIAFANVGMEIGKSQSKSQFYGGPVRTLGMVFSEMSSEAAKGELHPLIEKVNRLNDLWHKTKFFEEDGGASLQTLYRELLNMGGIQTDVKNDTSSPKDTSVNQAND